MSVRLLNMVSAGIQIWHRLVCLGLGEVVLFDVVAAQSLWFPRIETGMGRSVISIR